MAIREPVTDGARVGRLVGEAIAVKLHEHEQAVEAAFVGEQVSALFPPLADRGAAGVVRAGARSVQRLRVVGGDGGRSVGASLGVAESWR